jgi:hypothetical protein
MEAITLTGEGLVTVRVSGVDLRIDDSLYPELSDKAGQEVAITRQFGKWYAGARAK